MAVDDALRIAGGTARVAHGRRRALVQGGPVEAGLLGRQQLLVAQDLAGQGRGVAAADHDELLDGLQLVGHLRQDRHQRIVDQQHRVLGVVDDVDDLLWEQADIDSVQDRAHAGHGEVGFEVGLAVPGEGTDAVGVADAKAAQGSGQAVDALGDEGEWSALDAMGVGGDDLAVGVDGPPVVEEVSKRERELLHRTEHVALPAPGRQRRARAVFIMQFAYRCGTLSTA